MEDSNLRSLWEQRLAEYETSGKTIKEWCQEQSIRENQFYYWRRKIRPEKVEENQPIKWLSINLADSSTSSSNSIAVHIGQMTVEVKSGFDHNLLREILKVLQTV